ncbi:uncharacterized protein LOC113642838 isoform X3 [Tachysurus fulvidraco]|uniref:uncharacterized protein LOC113642838 isoform X3 n=1 Tax=Tachysurus fulvidraco TaxID=1234273 RepID=UPI001FEFD2DE|nr:uncharacterized protein LOC113642838 isoform X3 [Tachysurus fulvidraco]
MKTKVRHTLWKSLGPGFCQLRTADHCVFVCVCVCVGLPYSCQLTEQHLISVLDVFMRTSACNKREGTEDRKWHSEHIETCLKEFKKVKKIMDDGCEDTCKVLIAETPECFICRDVQLVDGEPLKRFCDCKNLMAHHSCLLTWVRMGLKLEDQLKCRVCNATYQQQRVAPWHIMISQWHVWTVLVVTMFLVALVPYTVYRMLTAFDNPPPHTFFNMAAICFGILSEILLLRLQNSNSTAL